MDALLHDLRYAAKMLLKRPMISAAAILCLGLGIGATTVVYSLIDNVLLRPLPYQDSEDLFVLWMQFPGQGIARSPVSGQEFLDIREQTTQTFERVGGMVGWSFTLTQVDLPQRLTAARMSADALQLLGAGTALGRIYTAEEERRGDAVAVISHTLWQRAFGGDPDILGRRAMLSDVPYEVIGVMASDHRPIDDSVELWVPLVPNPQAPRDRRGVLVFTRLADGIGPERAQADMDEVARRFAQDHPDLYQEDWRIRLVSLLESEVGDVRPRLTAFLGAVALVLLIACANVANLLMAQATAREKEVALRVALGAGRRALIRQFLTEGIVLGGLGGILGLGLALAGTKLVVTLELGNIPRIDEVVIDVRILAFTLALSLATGILFGLVPALRASAPDLQAALKEGGKTSATSRRHPLRNALVVIETALAVVVLIGAGLMLRSFQQLQDVDPGFRPDDLATMRLDLPFPAYQPIPERLSFYRRFGEELQAVPGIQSAGLVSHLPFTTAGLSGNIQVEGREADGDPGPVLGWRMISPAYFKTMGIPLIGGRAFDERDHVESTRVVIIDEATATRLWPGGNPLGERLKMVGWFREEWREVVGVVGRVKHQSLDDVAEQLYVPYQQAALLQIGVALRTSMDEMAAIAAVRDVVRSLDPNLPVFQPRTMTDMISESLAGPRFNLVLLALFGSVALVLAAVGVYGVLSYSVSQRRGEIGVRRALGARQRDVLKLILGQGMVLVGLGLGLGLLLAWLLTYLLSQLLGDMLYGITATDAATFAGVALALAATALVACLLPARRAARVDPMTALREE